MRALIASVSVVLALLYAAGAGHFYLQERWARTPFEVSPEDFSDLHHPEPTLGLVHQELQRNVPADPLPFAESHIRTALQLEPALTWKLLTALGRYNVPADRWTHLIPDDEQARRQLASVLFGTGQDAEALALLRLALNDPDAAYQSFRQALKHIESASGPSSTPGLELLCALAYEYLGRGEAVLAESLFTEASTLASTYAPASLGLARIYRRSGDDTAAMEQYQKVLRLDSDHPEAERELQQLLVTPDPRTSSLR